MPFDGDQVPFFSADFVALLAALLTMAITFAVLVGFGKWGEN